MQDTSTDLNVDSKHCSLTSLQLSNTSATTPFSPLTPTPQNRRRAQEKIPVAAIHGTENEVINVSIDTKQKFIRETTSILKGDIPSNESLGRAIDDVKLALCNSSDQLNNHGRSIAKDIESVLESFQNMIRKKNSDESIQRFLRNYFMYSSEDMGHLATLAEYDDKATLSGTSDIYMNVKQVVEFMIKNSSFREFIVNYISIVRSILVNKIDDVEAEKLINRIRTAGPKRSLADSMYQRNIERDPHEGNRELKNTNLILSIEERFQKLLLQLTKNPEYNQSVYNILSILDFAKARLEMVDSGTLPNENFNIMTSEAIEIIAAFTGRQKVDQFFSQFWSLFRQIRTDAEYRQYFHDLRLFTVYCIEHSDELTDQYLHKETTALVKRGTLLYKKSRTRYRETIDTLIWMFLDLLNVISNDPEKLDLQQKTSKLMRNIVADDEGRPDIFVIQDSIHQMKKLIVPTLQKQLERFPLPIIQGSNDSMEFSIENMTLSGRDLLPDHFRIEFTHDINFVHKNGPYSTYRIHIGMDNIRLAFNNIAFAVKRKKFPRIGEAGVVDVSIEGEGISLGLGWTLLQFDNAPWRVETGRVQCHIDELVIDVKQAKHRFLDRMLIKMFSGLVKHKIKEELSEKLQEALEPVTEQINQFFKYQFETHALKKSINKAMKKTYDVVTAIDIDSIRRDFVRTTIQEQGPSNSQFFV